MINALSETGRAMNIRGRKGLAAAGPCYYEKKVEHLLLRYLV